MLERLWRDQRPSTSEPKSCIPSQQTCCLAIRLIFDVLDRRLLEKVYPTQKKIILTWNKWTYWLLIWQVTAWLAQVDIFLISQEILHARWQVDN